VVKKSTSILNEISGHPANGFTFWECLNILRAIPIGYAVLIVPATMMLFYKPTYKNLKKPGNNFQVLILLQCTNGDTLIWYIFAPN